MESCAAEARATRSNFERFPGLCHAPLATYSIYTALGTTKQATHIRAIDLLTALCALYERVQALSTSDDRSALTSTHGFTSRVSRRDLKARTHPAAFNMSIASARSQIGYPSSIRRTHAKQVLHVVRSNSAGFPPGPSLQSFRLTLTSSDPHTSHRYSMLLTMP